MTIKSTEGRTKAAPIDVIFIHRQFPGQLRGLVEALSAWDQPLRLWGIGHRQGMLDGTGSCTDLLAGLEAYETHPAGGRDSSEVRILEAFEHGRSVATALKTLKQKGVSPALVIGHLGWGECTHVKSVFPKATLLGYCEFFHHAEGVDAGFDPEFGERDPEVRWRIREWNAVELLGLSVMDIGLSPTSWQRALFPSVYRPRIRILHEGVDAAYFTPDDTAAFILPSGRRLTRSDKVLTFATSSLEPYRGVHVFIRALPHLFKRHPDLVVVMAGDSSCPRYGRWALSRERDLICRLLSDAGVSEQQVHRVGLLPRESYRDLLRITSAHVYLTVPFVLSWSLMEAMAVGASIVASRTPPVEEVLRNDDNALLVDFFSSSALADAVDRLLSEPQKMRALGKRARMTILELYNRVETRQSYVRLVSELLAMRGTLGT